MATSLFIGMYIDWSLRRARSLELPKWDQLAGRYVCEHVSPFSKYRHTSSWAEGVQWCL